MGYLDCMAQFSREALSDTAVQDLLQDVSGWHYEDHHIQRVFKNRTYMHGAAFCMAVAHLAEELDHHPEMTLEYPHLQVRMQTHDAGGVTMLDIELARRINALIH